jgi:hypothetical protein
MKRLAGSRRRDRATSAPGTTQVAHCDQRLHAALATLEQCREVLIANASEETAQLVSMAILQLRMELNRITEAEWKAFCDALAPDRQPVPDPLKSTPRQKPTATIVGAASVTACRDGNAQAMRPPSPVFGRGLRGKNREGRT